jgi:hypothetical protein
MISFAFMCDRVTTMFLASRDGRVSLADIDAFAERQGRAESAKALHDHVRSALHCIVQDSYYVKPSARQFGYSKQTKWTPELVQQLERFWAEGLTSQEIGDKLDIEANTIAQRINILRRAGHHFEVRACSVQISIERVTEIADHCAAHFHTTRDAVFGHGRLKDGRTDARKAAAVALRDLGVGYPRIGSFFGAGHTSALYWCETATDLHKRAAREALTASQEASAA